MGLEYKTVNGLPIVSTRIAIDSFIIAHKPVLTGRDAVHLVAEHIYDKAREESYVVYTDKEGLPLLAACVGVGSQGECPVSVRDVVQIGLLCEAANVVFLHNHPTSVSTARNLKPSLNDLRITDAMGRALSLCGMTLVDSVIVSSVTFETRYRPTFYYSMRSKRLFEAKNTKKFKMDGTEMARTEDDIRWDDPTSFWRQEKAPRNTLESHPEDIRIVTGDRIFTYEDFFSK